MPQPDPPATRTNVGMRFSARQTEGAFLRTRSFVRQHGHAFDFETIADIAFLRALFAEPHRPHLLVQGSGPDVPGLATRIAGCCPASIHTCHIPGPLRLPVAPVATLMVRDAAELSVPQQIVLSDWMDVSEAQVVAVASVPLLPLVEAGRFLQGLFDRLSALQVNATRRSRAFGRAS